MNIGDLFLNLGIKGVDTALKGINSIKTGLSDVSSTGLAAKAAVLGVIYAVERMTSGASTVGAELTRYTNLTGESTEAVQKWGLAHVIAGGKAKEEMYGAFESAQKMAAKISLGGGNPRALGMLMAGGDFDIMKAVKSPLYFMEKVRNLLMNPPKGFEKAQITDFAEEFLNPEIIKSILDKSFHPENIKNSEILSPGNIESLKKVNEELARFEIKFQLFKDQFVAKHGLPLIEELSGALNVVKDLSVAFDKLTKKFPELNAVAKGGFLALLLALVAAGGPLTVLSAAVTGLIVALSEYDKHRKGKPSLIDSIPYPGHHPEWMTNSEHAVGSYMRSLLPSSAPEAEGGRQNVLLNVTMHGVDYDNSQKVRDAVHSVVKQVFRQTAVSSVAFGAP